MNCTKKCSELMNSNKNKLNGKISWLWPELDKFIENKMRRRIVKIKDIVTPNYPSHVM